MIFQHGNLKDCLMKVLSLLLHLAPSLSYIGTKTRVRFFGSCLKQGKITFTYKNIVNIYIVYEINLWDRGYDHYPKLDNSLLVQ